MRTKKNNLFQFIIIGLLISSSSCTKNNQKDSFSEKEKIEEPKVKIPNVSKTNEFYHYTSANNKKYDHQFTGTDENGEEVNGVINLEDEIGIGIVKGKNNNEIEIVSEDINYKEIIATDINGIKYKLKVD